MVGFPNLCKRLYTGGYLTVGLIKHCRTSCDLIYQITCAPLEYPLMSHFSQFIYPWTQQTNWFNLLRKSSPIFCSFKTRRSKTSCQWCWWLMMINDCSWWLMMVNDGWFISNVDSSPRGVCFKAGDGDILLLPEVIFLHVHLEGIGPAGKMVVFPWVFHRFTIVLP